MKAALLKLLFNISMKEKLDVRSQYRDYQSETGDWLWEVGEAFFRGFQFGLETKSFPFK